MVLSAEGISGLTRHEEGLPSEAKLVNQGLVTFRWVGGNTCLTPQTSPQLPWSKAPTRFMKSGTIIVSWISDMKIQARMASRGTKYTESTSHAFVSKSFVSWNSMMTNSLLS